MGALHSLHEFSQQRNSKNVKKFIGRNVNLKQFIRFQLTWLVYTFKAPFFVIKKIQFPHKMINCWLQKKLCHDILKRIVEKEFREAAARHLHFKKSLFTCMIYCLWRWVWGHTHTHTHTKALHFEL